MMVLIQGYMVIIQLHLVTMDIEQDQVKTVLILVICLELLVLSSFCQTPECLVLICLIILLGGPSDRPFNQFPHSTPGSASNHSSQHYPPYDYHNHTNHTHYPVSYHSQPPPGYPPSLPHAPNQWPPQWPPPVPDTRVNTTSLPPSNDLHSWNAYGSVPESRNTTTSKVSM